MFCFIESHFKSPDHPSLALQDPFVGERTHLCEFFPEFFDVVLLEGGPELGIGRGLGQGISASGSLDVQPRASAQDRNRSSFPDVLVGHFKGFLPLVEVEAGTGIHDVDQVVGDVFIFTEILARADVHSAVHLPGIRREDFRGPPEFAEPFGEGDGVAGFSGSGGS